MTYCGARVVASTDSACVLMTGVPARLCGGRQAQRGRHALQPGRRRGFLLRYAVCVPRDCCCILASSNHGNMADAVWSQGCEGCVVGVHCRHAIPLGETLLDTLCRCHRNVWLPSHEVRCCVTACGMVCLPILVAMSHPMPAERPSSSK